MIDLHTHILPGVDDGAKDVEMSLSLLQTELENGVDTVVLTPHFHPERVSLSDFLTERDRAFKTLSAAVESAGLPIRLLLGAEVYFTAQLSSLDLDPLCIGDTDYILVEFPFDRHPTWANDVFYEMMLKGKTPVIAHVERYPYFESDPSLLYTHVLNGCFAQINAGGVVKGNHSKTLKTYMKHNLIHFVVSDTHSPDKRPCRLKEAMSILDKKQPRFASQARENAQVLIQNGFIPSDPEEPKKRFRLFG